MYVVLQIENLNLYNQLIIDSLSSGTVNCNLIHVNNEEFITSHYKTEWRVILELIYSVAL